MVKGVPSGTPVPATLQSLIRPSSELAVGVVVIKDAAITGVVDPKATIIKISME
jgi:hypothetical protein